MHSCFVFCLTTPAGCWGVSVCCYFDSPPGGLKQSLVTCMILGKQDSRGASFMLLQLLWELANEWHSSSLQALCQSARPSPHCQTAWSPDHKAAPTAADWEVAVPSCSPRLSGQGLPAYLPVVTLLVRPSSLELSLAFWCQFSFFLKYIFRNF